MRIRFDPPPATVRAALIGCAELVEQQGDTELAAMARAASQADSTDGFPHEVFVIGLEDVRRAGLWTRVKSIGWRLILDEGDRGAAVEVHGVEGRGEFQFSDISEGASVYGTYFMLGRLEDELDLPDDSCSVCLLRVPALGITALWLRTHGRGEDRVLAIPPSHSDVDLDRIYPASEFESLVLAAAEAMGTAEDDELDELLN